MLVSCPVCGDVFTPKSVLAVYCSGLCRQRAYRERVALILQEIRGVSRVDIRARLLKEKAIRDKGKVVVKEDPFKKLAGESSIDFAIRKAEFNNK